MLFGALSFYRGQYLTLSLHSVNDSINTAFNIRYKINNMNEITKEKALKKKRFRLAEKTIESVMLICAFISVIAVLLITFLIFQQGLPLFSEVSPWDFVTGSIWNPGKDIYGILPMILASIYMTGIALIIAVPIGIGCAIFLSEISPRGISKVLRKSIEILAGIPSIVYGFFGMMMVVPVIRNLGDGEGFSLLAAGLILSVMILPTIISIAEVSLRVVPAAYKDGSFALGAGKWQTIKKVSIPTAKSGIITGTVLGIGRAVGETMAVILVAGNVPIIASSVFDPVRSMTVNIVLEMAYVPVGSVHYSALFATAIVLFIFIIIINATVMMLSRKRGNV